VRKNIFYTLALLAGALLVASCGKYNYIPEVTDADMKAQPEIYGKVGEPALQTVNVYPTNPAAATRTAVLKQLLFDENARGNYIDTARALRAMQE
jgi:hypothetical protein